MYRLFLISLGIVACSLQLFAEPGDTISLDEKWLFKISQTEASAPRDYKNSGCNDSQWSFQTIPGIWRVPTAWSKYNFVGTYRGWIKIPQDKIQHRMFLHIGTTTAVATVYVNGKKLGLTARDRAQTEFEITTYLNFGERNLFVIHMPHYEEGENANNTFGNSGITTHCFIYGIAPGQNLPVTPTIERAKRGVKVADRNSFQFCEGFFDKPSIMLKDINLMKKLGFGAITLNKLSSDPDFIAYAKTQGMDVVSDPPLTTEALIDYQGNFTMAAYNLLPPSEYDFKEAIKTGEGYADAAVAKPKPKKSESDALFSVWDKPYQITFNKHTGLITSYSQHSVSIFSGGGTVMPNVKTKLVSFEHTKPNKLSGTKVTVVYDIEGQGQVTWVYKIPNSGILSISAEGKSDILMSMSRRLNVPEYMAQSFDSDTTLTSLKQYRPRVYWVKQRDINGHGVQVIGHRPFTAAETGRPWQFIIEHSGKDFYLTFLPMM